MKNKLVQLLVLLILSHSGKLLAQNFPREINCRLSVYGNKEAIFCENFYVFFIVDDRVILTFDDDFHTTEIVVPKEISSDTTQFYVCVFYKNDLFLFYEKANILHSKTWEIEVGKNPLDVSDPYNPENIKFREITVNFGQKKETYTSDRFYLKDLKKRVNNPDIKYKYE